MGRRAVSLQSIQWLAINCATETLNADGFMRYMPWEAFGIDSLPLLQAGLDHRKNLPITGRAPFTANKQHRHPESSQFLTTDRTPLLLLGTLNGPGIIPVNLPLGLGKILPRAGSADGIGKDFQPAVDIPFVESLQNGLDPSRSLIRCGSRGRLAFQR